MADNVASDSGGVVGDISTLPKDTSKTGSSGSKRKNKKPPGIPETEDLYVLWDYFQKVGVDKPDFFQSIVIDDQAGFDELGELWSNKRVFTGVFAVAMAIYNLYTIVNFNVDIIRTTTDGRPTPGDGQLFLVSAPFLNQLVPDELTAGVKFEPVHMLAWMELLLLFGMYAWGVLNMVWMFSSDKVTKWHSVANFFFNTFPTLATIAMVRLLNYITPAVLVPGLTNAISRLKFRTGTCEFVFFIVTRIACLFLGLDAFLYKFQLIGFELSCLTRLENATVEDKCKETNGDEKSVQGVMIVTIAFVFQMLGVVQLGWFTKQRIFIFIFAGEDGAMDEKEDAIKRTWEAMVCYKLFEEHGICKSLWIYITFSDADFQKMVLDSKEDKEE